MDILNVLMDLQDMFGGGCNCPECRGGYGGGFGNQFPGYGGPFGGGFPGGGFPGAGFPSGSFPGTSFPGTGIIPFLGAGQPFPGFGQPFPGILQPNPGQEQPLPGFSWDDYDGFPDEDGGYTGYPQPPAALPAPPVRPPPERSASPPRSWSPPQDSTVIPFPSSNDRPRGPFYNDETVPEVPKLPPIDRSKKIQPKNPVETFLNLRALQASKTHPYSPGYPRLFMGGPTPTENLTLEQQSAKAFVKTCVGGYIRWNELGEDMYDLYKKNKVPEKLVSHLKYFLASVLPHLQSGGEVAPTDWPKVRRCIDWTAEVGAVFGRACSWHFGFGKDNGKARESGWWRDEANNFKGALRE